ncbi:MAG: VOC family protein [Gammaproteobacteria bacterium]|nr:VOC family protein [Gammaproteobacteria bacterium]
MRPFKILGIQQVAIGHRDLKSLEYFWCDLLGLEKYETFQSEKENVIEIITELGSGNSRVEIDLMQPLDESAKPAVHDPPLNHLGLWVDDLPSAVHWLQAKGVRFTPGGIRTGASGHPICFIHPKGNEQFPLSGLGVLIELVQAPESRVGSEK